MKVRILNAKGLHGFSEYIEAVRAGEILDLPATLLTDPETSEEASIDLELSHEEFPSRYKLGSSLVEAIGETDIQDLVGEPGFWSWLALYWFDQLCPAKADGSRKPSMVYHYVLSTNYLHRYRHAIYTTWQLVSRHGEAARFMLASDVAVRGELIEQMMARQYYLSCEGVIRAASQLYWDADRKTFKAGAASRKSAGCVSRFVALLQQLELTYDLYSLDCDQLLQLMPTEFDKFREAA